MILYYIYNILKFKKWKILFICIWILLCFSIINIIIQNLQPSLMQLTESHKCPACYGISMCHNIHKVNFFWHDINVIWSNLFGIKNVFFGTYNQNKIVLKKLAHSSELKQLDITYCNILRVEYPCLNISREKLDKHARDFHNLIKKTITSNFSKDDSSRLRLCPKIQHLDDLLHNVYLNNKHVDFTQYLINLWTLVSINPEPLILQILSAEDGWPVPKYFGACGRIIVEEYVGLPFADYYDKSWIQRAKIASSLLNAAYMFTFKDKNFGFYLTDVSIDNIAVDYKDIAKFIDLENIIVVDKNISSKDKSKEWQKLQENTLHFDCPNCFAFSPEDICNHHLSDHNYYAICQLLLGKEDTFFIGFLHDIPSNIQQQYPNIEYLLQQCAIPGSTNSRIIFGQQLKMSLDAILKKFVKENASITNTMSLSK